MFSQESFLWGLILALASKAGQDAAAFLFFSKFEIMDVQTFKWF